ncbi:MAG: ChbG/HpnK family deacetylase [Chloroflexi bacterium]|nr:ChbG/HpnK family deacetylase [Chloroflexota bacterium]
MPQSQVKSLVDENGWFLKYEPFVANLPNLNLAEVEREWRTQIEAFISTTGKAPTHLDSHHHASYFSPELMQAMLQFAREYECPIRFPYNGPEDPLLSLPPEIVPSFRESGPRLIGKFKVKHPNTFISHFYDQGVTQETLTNILNTLPQGTHELMCHPGYVDDVVIKATIYNQPRARELEILTSAETRKAIESNNIQLASFEDL